MFHIDDESGSLSSYFRQFSLLELTFEVELGQISFFNMVLK